MRTTEPTPAYVLWLLRERLATTRKQLSQYFRADFSSHAHFALDRSLNDLKTAGLVSGDLFTNDLYLTEKLSAIQHVFDVSLPEVVFHPSSKSMLVSPMFGKPIKNSCGRDIFVLMPFSPELKPVYDVHIVRVAKSLKKTVVRADEFSQPTSITADIWTGIVHSKAIIADCTGRNPNVFYELGLAHAIGKPVVLITKEPKDVPFDIAHLRYIHYDDTPEGMKVFRARLRDALRSIDGELRECDPEAIREETRWP